MEECQRHRALPAPRRQLGYIFPETADGCQTPESDRHYQDRDAYHVLDPMA